MEELRQIRRRRMIRTLQIAAVLLILFVALAASLRIHSVTIEGNDRYTDEELEALLFPDDWSRNPLVFLLRERAGKSREIPFVEKYTVIMTGIRSVKIIVYEKDIIGCVNKMGSYLYFDQDGYVVESSSEKMEDVPEVSGLATDYIVLGDRLPVEDESIFQEVLNVTQYLQSAEIVWEEEERTLVSLLDVIRVDDEGNVTCVFGEISVYLGSYEDMEEKLLEMTSILPELNGRSGTLYLDTYEANAENPAYVFK